jgi:hypothetical protein
VEDRSAGGERDCTDALTTDDLPTDELPIDVPMMDSSSP